MTSSDDHKVRIDQTDGCEGCYNYRSRKVFIPYAKPFTVYYCNALSDAQYEDVQHYQGHGSLTIHYPIVYAGKRLYNCPLKDEGV